MWDETSLKEGGHEVAGSIERVGRMLEMREGGKGRVRSTNPRREESGERSKEPLAKRK